MGPIWSRGTARSNRKSAKVYKSKRERTGRTKIRLLFFKCGAISSKIGGLTRRLLWYYEKKKKGMKMLYKHIAQRKADKADNEPFSIEQMISSKSASPNGTVLIVYSCKAGSRQGRSLEFGVIGFGWPAWRKCCPGGAFLKIQKIVKGTQSQLFIKSWHWDPVKTFPRSGLEKNIRKTMGSV